MQQRGNGAVAGAALVDPCPSRFLQPSRFALCPLYALHLPIESFTLCSPVSFYPNSSAIRGGRRPVLTIIRSDARIYFAGLKISRLVPEFFRPR
jgi:hypothetical protein